MLHCDEETLSLLALGETGPADAEAHIADCPRCSAELTALRNVVRTARTGLAESAHADPDPDRLDDLELLAGLELLGGLEMTTIHPIAPPPRVWDEIAAATGVRAKPHPGEVHRHATTDVPLETGRVRPALEPVADPPAPPAEPATSAPAADPGRPGPDRLPRQRSRSWAPRLDRRVLSIAAACLVVGLLGGVVGTRLLSDGTGSTGSDPVLAATALDGLAAAPGASGQADVTGDGPNRTLALDVRDLGRAEGFYEVWLIDPTVTKMIPVGVLSGSTGRFTLPPGVDLADYPVVDISAEPLDGDPTHSGKSVLRGTLPT